MIDKTFDLCVESLEALAEKLGVTYKEINVAIFCVGWPLLTAGLVVACLKK